MFLFAGRAVRCVCDSDLEQVCIERGVTRSELEEETRVLPRELTDELGEIFGREFGVNAVEFCESW